MRLALVRKELREHWLVLCVVLVLGAFMLLGLMIRGDKHGGRFTALMEFAVFLGPLSALVAANRLFVREYAGRTQLFLEVLPIGRAQVWATKWMLGLAYIGMLTVAAWSAMWLRALRTEAISAHDALLVLLSVGSFELVVWCFASMAGMLGRHRYTAWFAALGVAGILIHGKFRIQEFPVMRLLGPHVAMARAPFAWSPLLEAWSLAACFGAACAALALAGSGAIASALAQKITARERVFVFVAIIVGVLAYETFDKERSKPPYTVADAIYANTGHARVGVLRRGGIAASDAEQMAQTVADDLESSRGALGLGAVPPVFILPKRGLDPMVVERAELDESEGIVLRAAPNVVLSTLRTEVLHAALADQTRRRALREDRHVLLDGFAVWWALRANANEREQRWLRAAASRLAVTVSTLTRWAETEELVGSCVADALAFATVDVLARRLGSNATRTFARSLFSRPADDVRVLFERPPAALLKAAGVTWSALAAQTERERQAVMARSAVELARAAERSATVEVKQSARRGPRIEVGLAGAEAYWALYTVLGPWAAWQSSLSRLDVRAPRATLPLSAASHARVLVAIETDDDVLHCPVRVTSKRLTLP